MSTRNRIVRILLITFLLSVLCPSPAYAYLDPGSGSYIIQIVVAGLLGVSLTAKVYWNKIKSVFSKKGPDEKQEEPDETP